MNSSWKWVPDRSWDVNLAGVEAPAERRTTEWSPDGTEIAYSVDQPFASQLTFINVQTRAQEQPLPKKALIWQYDPSWSAVGDRLAFTGNKHPIPPILDGDLHNAWKAKQTIFIVNRDGTGLQQLVEAAGPKAQYPALSPHGKKFFTHRKSKEISKSSNLI